MKSKMTESQTEQKRIMVVLGTFQDFQAILETAASLAAHQNAELSALLVEDVNLIHLAGLPFATEIDLISHSEQQFDLMKVSEALENEVQQIRRLLAEVKERAKLPVSLKVVRGHFLTEAITAAEEVELLLLNQRGGRVTKTHIHWHREESTRPIWVILDESPAADRSLALAVEMMRSHHTDLNIVLKVHAVDRIAHLKEKVHQFVSGSQVNVHFYVEQSDDFSSVLPYIVQRGCSIIIMGRGDPGVSQKLISLMSDKGGCPLLLVS